MSTTLSGSLPQPIEERIKLYTYKFRLQPNKLQTILLNKHIGATRYVYNYFLNQKKIDYQNYKQETVDNTKFVNIKYKGSNYYDNANELTRMKKVEETGWLKEVNSQTLQYGVKCLDGAFQRFFKKTAGFPKFHNRFRKNSFTIPANTRIKNSKLVIPKFLEGIEIIMHRPIDGEICTSTISKEPTGEYYVAITVERDLTKLIKQHYQPTGKIVGIDLGIKDLIISSDPTTPNEKNPKNTYKYQDQLKKFQQHLSKKVKGSNNRNKARLKVTRIHKKISNSRKDAIHKATTNLVRNNDIIIMENLKTKNMVRNRKLAKAISDSSFGEIKRQLEYKTIWYDKILVKIGTFYPSSKTCSACGWIKQDLTLKDRRWSCTQCAISHDRDVNASKNILSEGLRNISSGTGDYTHGADVSLDLIKQLALKWEAQGSLALE
ncbi:MAG: RNA-guided endonuclease TnpB family protein [Patescibacteria group bacterium]